MANVQPCAGRLLNRWRPGPVGDGDVVVDRGGNLVGEMGRVIVRTQQALVAQRRREGPELAQLLGVGVLPGDHLVGEEHVDGLARRVGWLDLLGGAADGFRGLGAEPRVSKNATTTSARSTACALMIPCA